jgi:hypothetical protein
MGPLLRMPPKPHSAVKGPWGYPRTFFPDASSVELIEPLRNLLHCGASPTHLAMLRWKISEPKVLGHFG